PEASLDLDLRFSLYRNSYAALAWSGGTASVLPLCGGRFMTFGIWHETGGVGNTDFCNRKGPAIGQQPAWFDTRFQHYDWLQAEKVTADYILAKTLPWLAG